MGGRGGFREVHGLGAIAIPLGLLKSRKPVSGVRNHVRLMSFTTSCAGNVSNSI